MTSGNTIEGGVARVECAQLSPVVGDLAGNQELVLAAVRSARDRRIDLLVLPELATSGYVFESVAEARANSIPRDDPFFTSVAALLIGSTAVVVVGFAELALDTSFSSVALIDATGVRAVYRKTHLWNTEKLYFTAGSEPAPVVETTHGRIGLLVCYDLEFPEMPRSLALAGADVVAVPTNWPLGTHPAGEHPTEIIMAMAAARSNGIFLLLCDRDGVERGQQWERGTAIIDQFGWIVSSAGDSATASADIFPMLARDKAISAHNDLLGDRRPELYTI